MLPSTLKKQKFSCKVLGNFILRCKKEKRNPSGYFVQKQYEVYKNELKLPVLLFTVSETWFQFLKCL